MITLTKNGNAIVFTFSDNAHYLFDGTIEVPVNSLTLITDNSQMATFKKSASNDIFISATYAELGMSKSELESWFKENACGSTGGGGVTSGEVETMIETSLEDYYDIDEVDAALSAKANTTTTYNKTEVDTALANKADTSAVTASIAAAVSGKQDTLIAGSGITISGNVISSEGGNKVVELTQAQYDALVDKDPDTFYIITDAEAIDINNYYTKTEVDTALANKADTSAVTESINEAVSGKQDTLVSGVNIKTINNESLLGEGNITIQGGGGVSSGEVETMIAESISGKVNTSAYNAYTAATDSRLAEDEEVTAAGLNALNDALGDKADTSAVTASIAAAVSGKVDTSAVTSSVTSASTDTEIPTAKAVYDAVGQGGGGATYSAGTNISIDTANTINCTLPISAVNSSILIKNGSNNISTSNLFSQVFGSGNTIAAYGGYNQNCITVEGISNSCATQATHVEGGYNINIYGSYSHVEGAHNELSISISPYTEVCSHVEGKYNKVLNYSEHASGQYNNSVSASTTFGDSGNTLFSVGNGTANNARHNAFEIRQNGDIYCSDGTNDVKLQDTITATAANTTALGGLSLVKISQSDYDQLATKDPNTLYVIVD